MQSSQQTQQDQPKQAADSETFEFADSADTQTSVDLSSADLDPRAVFSGARRDKFFSYYRPHLKILAADLVCAILVAATTLALPLCANYIVKQLTAGTEDILLLQQVMLVGVFMLVLIALETASRLFVDYQGHVMGARMETDMREELFEHYQKLSFSFYDRQRVGQLMSRISNDLFALAELYHHGPEDVAIALLKFFGAMIILFVLSPELASVIALSVPFAVAYALYFNRRMGIAVRQSKERVSAINERVEASLSGVRVVKAFGGEMIEMARFNEQNEHFLQTRRRGYRAEALFSAGLQTYTQLLTLMVIVFGALAIQGADMSVADLMTFLLCIAILVDPIARAANFARLWQEGITGFHRFMEVLEVAPDIEDAPGAVVLENARGEIDFRDVSFRYPTAAQDAIKGINLSIQPGEFVALVGHSGVGKTTICSLIPRFYDATQGVVSIDGTDVRRITTQSLRRNIGLVQQDVYLFAGTVRENIAYGNQQASDADIIEAAKMAYADEFISALSEGYDTFIGERGVRLSGGQKQRLTIARTFLKNPPILIFDEATSALDTESERAIQSALLSIARGRTTIVIAHRLSTIMHADRIIVLTADGIVEEGTHEALMNARGAYFRMHETRAGF